MNCRSAVTAPVLAALLAGCASAPPAGADLQGLLPTPLLLLGEQHDAPEHQALQRATVTQLARQGALAALVLEMVEQGRKTTGLPPDASEIRVREALDWRDASNSGAWPWTVYGPVVMSAVRAGAPVIGGNLPRAQMRTAMADTALDNSLPPMVLQRQRDAIRDGHCGLLPEAQIAPMTRIQIARDRAMAQTAMAALYDNRTVLLIAGNGHVQRDLGVPRHLPPGQAHRVVLSQARERVDTVRSEPGTEVSADRHWVTPPRPATDHCADLKKRMGR